MHASNTNGQKEKEREKAVDLLYAAVREGERAGERERGRESVQERESAQERERESTLRSSIPKDMVCYETKHKKGKKYMTKKYI